MSFIARPFQPLALHRPASVALPVVPPELRVRPRDPARTVFTDLHEGPLVFVHDDTHLNQALVLMLQAGVRMAFVRDRASQVTGFVTAAALQGERGLVQAGHRGTTYDELTVADVMTPVSRWDCADVACLKGACVGDVVATLRETGLRYLVVTERRSEGEAIRGLFSASRIERALGEPIQGDPTRPRHVADMVTAETNVNV